MMKKSTLFVCLFALCSFVANAVPSGIYLMGGVNSWGLDQDVLSEWEFDDNGDGTYTLSDKSLFGEFKIGDPSWSTYNYGSNGSVPQLGEAYTLAAGGGNINLGDVTYNCETITLTVAADGSATLLIEGTEEVAGELTCVYVMGNNNDWDFTDESGKLELTETPGVFEGTIVMVAPEDGEFCFWRIFEGLGMVGSWGMPADLAEDTREGTLTKGQNGCVTTVPGTYVVTFDINTGNFSLEEADGAVQAVAADGVKVVGGNGQITICGCDNAAVYTVGGALVSEGAATVEVPAGLYIVKTGDKVTKVVVR